MLQEEFNYFTKNHDDLFDKYPNKYLIIQNQQVLYFGDTLSNALDWAIKKGLKEGEFMLQLCSEGDKAYTMTFHSRVIYA